MVHRAAAAGAAARPRGGEVVDDLCATVSIPRRAGTQSCWNGRRWLVRDLLALPSVRRADRLERLKHAYLIGAVPWYVWPLHALLAAIGSAAIAAYLLVLRLTCRVELRGPDPRALGRNYVLAVWHEFLIPVLVCLAPFRRHVWLNHPYWYMRGLHLVLAALGIRLELGSSGSGGRAAADRIAARLREGWSSFVNPDGPEGPWRQLKKGVLHLARQGECPIIPVHFQASLCLRGRAWDQKIYPLPFATITATFGAPIEVTAANLDAWHASAAAWMSPEGEARG